ncbi:MAG: polysaccharide pyruvyl transferase family protein [Thiobacillus sp.]
MTDTSTVLHAFRRHISQTLDALIPSGTRCALVDFPHHANVGDPAIWLGEMAYLKQRTCRIAYSCDAINFNPAALRAAVGPGIILIQGGGNFGDLYPNHQKIRERIVREFPENRIIQLPQSIHFSDAANLARSQSILGQHRDFHFIVRDTVSLQFAQQHYSNPTYLCPDMALMLDLKPLRSQSKTSDVVILSRMDEEKASRPVSGTAMQLSSVVADWLDEPVPKHQWLYDWSHRRLDWDSSKVPPFVLNKLALAAANAMARQRLARGLELLGRGNVVITDRLHAVILSWLGGTPIFYVDNNYNKLSNFINTWLKDSPNLLRCASFEDALTQVQAQAQAEYGPTATVMTSSRV